MVNLDLTVLDGEFAVCRLPRSSSLPLPAGDVGPFWSVTVTGDEVSVVCRPEQAPGGAVVESGWGALKVEGPLEFELVGILANLSGVLAEAKVSVFAVSTYDTDYLLTQDLDGAIEALSVAGHRIAR
ncbi:ACT domain-containing protein [Solicola gregarius]|uniref:ACT domain-containing protein n=1 Tax=Solicola gregarius TaxID=2908642 RepID=A0AA46YP42_9ACTN|nr:ACT domain-containing protein [Solicola gregarius]UYM07258.1 ACT domain-containing protein [Solicola gregarius]